MPESDQAMGRGHLVVGVNGGSLLGLDEMSSPSTPRPGGLHTGADNWNRMWREFFRENRNAGKKEILKQLEYMKRKFGIK